VIRQHFESAFFRGGVFGIDGVVATGAGVEIGLAQFLDFETVPGEASLGDPVSIGKLQGEQAEWIANPALARAEEGLIEGGVHDGAGGGLRDGGIEGLRGVGILRSTPDAEAEVLGRHLLFIPDLRRRKPFFVRRRCGPRLTSTR